MQGPLFQYMYNFHIGNHFHDFVEGNPKICSYIISYIIARMFTYADTFLVYSRQPILFAINSL